ncbi:ATP-binding protein [Nocardioides marinquilinus]|uniref:ATP-binding protein n=1 Tax=Nocardioides marinquilinus TaxID=1210400 RepID=UPI0031E652DF
MDDDDDRSDETTRSTTSNTPEVVADWTMLATALVEHAVTEVRSPGDVDLGRAQVERAREAFRQAAATPGPLQTVVHTVGLDQLEAETLAVCAGIELDGRLLTLLGTLVRPARTPARPTVQLLVDLLGPEVLGVLAPNSRLTRAGLVSLESDVPMAGAQVLVPRRVLWALLGDPSLDPALPPGTEFVTDEGDDDRILGASEKVLVVGEDPVRRRQAAVRFTRHDVFISTRVPTSDDEWLTLVRQASLVGAGLVLETGDRLDSAGREWLERAEHLPVALTSSRPLPLESLPQQAFLEVAADPPAVTDDEWAAVYPSAAPPIRRPTAQQLWVTAHVSTGVPDAEEQLRRTATGSLLQHATRIVPRVEWDDLVLPPSQERQLRNLVDRYHQRSRVHDDWGLSLYPSPGVVALFSGPSGTGKTTSAEVVAKELGLEMFRVDLSALVSKYIGETEKNLEEIFSAAHTGNYLLLFDEADSLFGSRSKVEDAKDRYANMEVSYLLQRLETYDGVVVLTSNFQGNIDQAFLRRIHVTVAFSVPTAEERERIWDRSLGGAPRADLDLAFVAEKFDLTGGSIRNAALTAAFAAAAAGTEVGMVEVLSAVTTEFTKLGRRTQDSQYGPWLAAVRNASR